MDHQLFVSANTKPDYCYLQDIITSRHMLIFCPYRTRDDVDCCRPATPNDISCLFFSCVALRDNRHGSGTERGPPRRPPPVPGPHAARLACAVCIHICVNIHVCVHACVYVRVLPENTRAVKGDVHFDGACRRVRLCCRSRRRE